MNARAFCCCWLITLLCAVQEYGLNRPDRAAVRHLRLFDIVGFPVRLWSRNSLLCKCMSLARSEVGLGAFFSPFSPLFGNFCRDLRFSGVTQLPDGVFDSLSSLTFLYVSKESTLEPSDPGVLSFCLHLRFFFLFKASIVVAQLLLSHRGLSQNDLTELPPGIFDSLTDLQNLYVLLGEGKKQLSGKQNEHKVELFFFLLPLFLS